MRVLSVALAVAEVVAASEVVDLTDDGFDAFIAEHETTMVSTCCCGMYVPIQIAAILPMHRSCCGSTD